MSKCLSVLIREVLFSAALFAVTVVYNFTSNTSEVDVDNSLPTFEKSYKYWNVFTITQNNGKVCYITSNPIDMIGNHPSVRKPYIIVSLFGANKVEISISADFQMRINTIVPVSIDGIQERFIAENEHFAWAEKRNADKRIVKYMINGTKLLVFYESIERTYAVDTYSLKGFTKAYQRAQQLCQHSNIINTTKDDNIEDDAENILDDYEKITEENQNMKSKNKKDNISTR